MDREEPRRIDALEGLPFPRAGIFDLAAEPEAGARFGGFLAGVCDRLGFDYAAYAGTNLIDGSVHAYVNYPEGWKEHYRDAGFHRIDPTLSMASRSIAPVDWQRVRGHSDFRRVFWDAHDFGIGELGLTIPVRGPYGDVGMFSATRNCGPREWEALVPRTVGELQSVAVHLHDAAMRSDALSHVLRRPMLSKREAEILQWVAAGKAQQDVADILGVARRTIEVHLASARDKLGALNTPQAVARAVVLGLIHPS